MGTASRVTRVQARDHTERVRALLRVQERVKGVFGGAGETATPGLERGHPFEVGRQSIVLARWRPLDEPLHAHQPIVWAAENLAALLAMTPL